MFRTSNPPRDGRRTRQTPWRSLMLALMLVLPVGLALAAASAMAQQAQQPNGATIQWAQQILDDKGFYQGRAHGRMDAATVAAVRAYQSKQGLPVTGRLDRATIDRMLEGRPQQDTVGNLADPGNRARPSAPLLREDEVVPQAAPVAPSVERPAEATVAPPPIGAAPAASATAGEPGPTAAPRTAVDAASPDPANGVGPGGGFDLRNLDVPIWVQLALLGSVGIVILGMLLVFLSSGRRSGGKRAGKARGKARGVADMRRAPVLDHPGEPRREPSFGPPPPPPVRPGGLDGRRLARGGRS